MASGKPRGASYRKTLGGDRALGEQLRPARHGSLRDDPGLPQPLRALPLRHLSHHHGRLLGRRRCPLTGSRSRDLPGYGRGSATRREPVRGGLRAKPRLAAPGQHRPGLLVSRDQRPVPDEGAKRCLCGSGDAPAVGRTAFSLTFARSLALAASSPRPSYSSPPGRRGSRDGRPRRGVRSAMDPAPLDHGAPTARACRGGRLSLRSQCEPHVPLVPTRRCSRRAFVSFGSLAFSFFLGAYRSIAWPTEGSVRRSHCFSSCTSRRPFCSLARS